MRKAPSKAPLASAPLAKTPLKMPPASHWQPALLAVTTIVVLILGCLIGFRLATRSDVSEQPNTNAPVNSVLETGTDTNTTGSGDGVTVTWNTWPVAATSYDVFDYDTLQNKWQDGTVDAKKWIESVDVFRQLVTAQKLGVVADGTYAGDAIYWLTCPAEGPTAVPTWRVIKHGTELIGLKQYSRGYGCEGLLTVDETLTISNLEPAAEIAIPNSNLILHRTKLEAFRLLSSYENPQKLLTAADGTVLYRDVASGCLFAPAVDSSVHEYAFGFDWLATKAAQSEFDGVTPVKLNLTMGDGKANTAEYVFKSIGPCGSGCYNYRLGVKTDQLQEIGKTNTGDSIYAAKTPDSVRQWQSGSGFEDISALQSTYDSLYTPEGQTKPTFDQFVADYPLLYWQDPFGNFVELRNSKYQPAVECGKPVIYLYPTKTTDVSVQVTPAGGLTITKPAYGKTGWLVKAEPSGQLYNYTDKKTYLYLFWEGYGLNYQAPKEGFVIAKADVASFLAKSLAKLGLNKTEAADFKAFWQSKLEASPYVFVTFLPQAQFDKLAPLQVKPAPDTVIRVFMDYQPLSQPIAVAPQTLTAPARQGFTVVEWGGALHR